MYMSIHSTISCGYGHSVRPYNLISCLFTTCATLTPRPKSELIFAQSQILDLANVKIESEEDFKAVIEKIPDYRIKPERVSQ